MTIEEVSKYLKYSVATLAIWRSTGDGPKFTKVGKFITYDKKDVDEWVLYRQKLGVPGLSHLSPEPAPSNEQLRYERLVNTSGATGIYEPDLEAVRQAKLRRNRIAEGFAFALVGRQSWHSHEEVVVMAIKYADALIAELDK